MSLPLCDLTEIPRLLCDHCESFTMTEDERRYLAGWEVYAPATRTPGQVRALPEYSGGSWSEPHDVKISDSATICRTPGCTRPSGDAFVCSPCIDDLEVCLGDVPKLEEDLLLLAMRQARFTAAAKGSDRTPLPVNLAASERLAYLNAALVSAVKQITEQRGLPTPRLVGPTRISRWLLCNVRAVAMDEGGGDIVADVKREHARAMRAIDCPPDRTYIGLCDECRAPMHAKDEDLEYRCRDCGAEYAVAERIAKQRAKVRESLLSLREIADLSDSQLGGKITLKQLEGLVRRDKLKPVSHRPGNGRHEQIALYRAADVVAIMERRRAS